MSEKLRTQSISSLWSAQVMNRCLWMYLCICVFLCIWWSQLYICVIFAWSGLLIAAADDFIMDIPVEKKNLNAFSRLTTGGGPSKLLTIPPEVFMKEN